MLKKILPHLLTIPLSTFLKWGIINGLSDHDVQSITLHSFNLRPHTKKKCMLIRKTKESTINHFLIKLIYETWDTIFSTDDVNKMFNSFLDTYLKFFYSIFPLNRVHIAKKKMDFLRNFNAL